MLKLLRDSVVIDRLLDEEGLFRDVELAYC